MICQSLCGYLLPFSGKKQNISSLLDCHPFCERKSLLGNAKSHIITISSQLAAKYWSYQGSLSTQNIQRTLPLLRFAIDRTVHQTSAATGETSGNARLKGLTLMPRR
ncbi:hypothetical protein FNH63_10550 [Salmonella enterica subsp. salamae]|nr:hypothetical protein [Salmonella enterica]ECJ5917973.1 hypothetical protein [Salmonella enterica subsp. salamae]ECW0041765.1 hypothetical protein [Salmonella enterica]EDX9485790.1 hypothetical protein [Salmonella enterica]